VGNEQDEARKAANEMNTVLRKLWKLKGKSVDIHEIQPVKFGGSPIAPSNKVIIDRGLHQLEVTPWWNDFQKSIGH
jgi:hypothetical protein